MTNSHSQSSLHNQNNNGPDPYKPYGNQYNSTNSMQIHIPVPKKATLPYLKDNQIPNIVNSTLLAPDPIFGHQKSRNDYSNASLRMLK